MKVYPHLLENCDNLPVDAGTLLILKQIIIKNYYLIFFFSLEKYTTF